jgi:16S rRNA (guanine966-N2)-methyltransferase
MKTKNLVRPTSSRVIKSIFDILGNIDLKGNKFLDLFAGTGKVGFTAYLKNYEVTSVEKNKKNIVEIKQLSEKKNIKLNLINSDAINFLRSTEQKFDVVFIDPPYLLKELYYQSLEIITTKKLLNLSGKIIIEKSSKINLLFSDFNYMIKNYKYGDTEILLLWIK